MLNRMHMNTSRCCPPTLDLTYQKSDMQRSFKQGHWRCWFCSALRVSSSTFLILQWVSPLCKTCLQPGVLMETLTPDPMALCYVCIEVRGGKLASYTYLVALLKELSGDVASTQSTSKRLRGKPLSLTLFIVSRSFMVLCLHKHWLCIHFWIQYSLFRYSAFGCAQRGCFKKSRMPECFIPSLVTLEINKILLGKRQWPLAAYGLRPTRKCCPVWIIASRSHPSLWKWIQLNWHFGADLCCCPGGHVEYTKLSNRMKKIKVFSASSWYHGIKKHFSRCQWHTTPTPPGKKQKWWDPLFISSSAAEWWIDWGVTGVRK